MVVLTSAWVSCCNGCSCMEGLVHVKQPAEITVLYTCKCMGAIGMQLQCLHTFWDWGAGGGGSPCSLWCLANNAVESLKVTSQSPCKTCTIFQEVLVCGSPTQACGGLNLKAVHAENYYALESICVWLRAPPSDIHNYVTQQKHSHAIHRNYMSVCSHETNVLGVIQTHWKLV